MFEMLLGYILEFVKFYNKLYKLIKTIVTN